MFTGKVKLFGNSAGFLIALFFLTTIAASQEAKAKLEIELNSWKSKSGKTSSGLLLSIDEKSKKVTLLIPREISFDDLDAESIELARTIALQRQNSLTESETAKDASATKSPESPKEGQEKKSMFSRVFGSKKSVGPKPKDSKWYLGGTLHSKSALEWQSATPEDKIATCADFIASLGS